MLSTSLRHAPAGTTPSAVEVDACLASLAAVSSETVRIAGRRPDAHDAAEARGLGCMRGLSYAIAAEFLAVMFCYGAWRLVHVLLH